jgi:hypothetical protein
VPSGMGVPEEMRAAISRARRDLPQPWSPSRRVIPAKGRRFCQSQRTGCGVGLARLFLKMAKGAVSSLRVVFCEKLNGSVSGRR